MVDEKDDDDKEEIAPGIVKTVDWLSGNGFDCFDSGDGCDEVCGGCGAAHDDGVGFVAISCHPAHLAYESQRLLSLLRSKVSVPAWGKDRPVNSIDIEAKYEPLGDFCVIEVINITDAKVFGEEPKSKALSAN